MPRYFTTVEGNKTFRQIVKSGESLVRPEVLPSPLGRTFMGWHIYDPSKAGTEGFDSEGYAIEEFDFNSPVVFEDEGETEFILRAMFDRVGYVIFHEQPIRDSWPITAVRRGIMREVSEGLMMAEVNIDDVVVTYDDSVDEEGQEHANGTPKMIFRGWSREKVMPGCETNVLGEAVTLESSPFMFTRQKDTPAVPRHLYPVFVDINWLSFQAASTGQGATYIPPKFYYADEFETKLAVP